MLNQAAPRRKAAIAWRPSLYAVDERYQLLAPATERRSQLLRRLLMVADLMALVLAYVVVDGYRVLTGVPPEILLKYDLPILLAGMPVWCAFAYAFGLYHMHSRRVEHGVADEVGPIFQMTGLWGWSVLLVGAATGIATPPVGQLAVFWAAATILLIVMRSAARSWSRRQGWYRQRALVVGTDSQLTSLSQKLARHPEYGIDVAACIDSDQGEDRRVGGVPVLGEDVSVLAQVSALDVDRVFLAWSPSAEDREERFELARTLSERGVRVDMVPSWFEVLGAKLELNELEGMPILTVPYVRLGSTTLFIKRAFDFLVSTSVLLMLAPLLLVCAAAIRLDSKGPVFFRQKRVGRDGEPFEVFKFRSMYADAEQRKAEVAAMSFHGGGMTDGMFKIKRDPRITRVGAFLRRTSLDELPQLINIVRGEMSLVGPRPLIEDEDRQVEGRFRRRLALTPGLTGLWQVNGRSEIPFETMVNLDYLYVTSWSLWADIKILIKTVPAVIGSKGAY